MLIYVLSTSAIIFAAGIGYISYRYKLKASNDAKSITDAYAHDYANLIKAEIDKEFGVSRGMAQAMLAIEDSDISDKAKLHIETMNNVLKNNPNYIAAFLQWDLSDCQPGYSKAHGRRRYISFRKHPAPFFKGQVDMAKLGKISSMTGIVDTISYDPQNPYYIVKNTLQEFIIDPYFYTYDDIGAMPEDKPKGKKSVLETTIIVPLITNKKFRALTGVDIPINHFNEIIKDIQPFEQSYAFIVANNGTLVAHPNPKLLGDSVTWYIDESIDRASLLAKIKNGKPFTFTQDDEYKGELYYSVAPIKMGRTNTPWAIGIRVPMNVMMADANKHFETSLVVGIIGLIVLSIIIWQISLNITRPIQQATKVFKDLAQGKIEKTKKLSENSNDEIAEMARSANKLIDGFKHTSQFAKKIGEGNLNADYQLLSDDDELGMSLVEMREKLKQSTEEIEKSSRELDKLSKVAQKTDNAVLITDNKGKIEWVNQAFIDMYGYDLTKLQQIYNGDLLQLSTHPNIDDLVDDCLAQKKSIHYNSMIKSTLGKPVFAQTTISPILDEDGEVTRLAAIDSNITEIKQAQEEIKTQRDQLEQQRNQLQQVNATKDKFFSILAHDLKNPFSSLHSLSEMLVGNFGQFDDDDKLELAKKIKQNAGQIYQLLEDLLTWSRFQRGIIEFHPVQFNLSQLVDINTNINRSAAEKKQIELVSELEKEVCAHGDREMASTVLRNLTNNAVKFTNSNGKVTISTTKTNDGMLEVAVQDNGIGISKEDQEKLFRIDIKTKSIGKSKEKGTGLGLILCKEFVEKNGGKIWVESEEGKGSCFRFTLKGALNSEP